MLKLIVAFIALLVWAACDSAPVEFEAPSCDGCNVVLLTFDALRADHLGLYGYPKNTSPELDRFAQESFVFTDAMAQSGSTVNSLPALHTSKFPFIDGIREGRSLGLKAQEVTLAECLKARGYHTAAVIGWRFAESKFGLAQGFDDFDEDHQRDEAGERTIKRAVGLLETLPRPFFLWIHVRPPHDPYDVPDELFEAFYTGTDSVPTLQTSKAAVVLEHTEPSEGAVPTSVYGRKPHPYTPSMIEQLVAMYDANIRQADRAFGRLAEFLRSTGRMNDTIVVVGSDHGESMGEHELFGHNSLDYGVVRVPLLLRLPSGQHRVLRHPVMNVDVFPTLLGQLGIDVEHPVRGIDLFQSQRAGYFQFAEYENQRAIKQGNWMLLQRRKPRKQPRLFDVLRDPLQTKDLAGLEPDKVRELVALSRSLKSIDLRDVPLQEDSRSLEELRALGYIE